MPSYRIQDTCTWQSHDQWRRLSHYADWLWIQHLSNLVSSPSCRAHLLSERKITESKINTKYSKVQSIAHFLSNSCQLMTSIKHSKPLKWTIKLQFKYQDTFLQPLLLDKLKKLTSYLGEYALPTTRWVVVSSRLLLTTPPICLTFVVKSVWKRKQTRWSLQ